MTYGGLHGITNTWTGNGTGRVLLGRETGNERGERKIHSYTYTEQRVFANQVLTGIAKGDPDLIAKHLRPVFLRAQQDIYGPEEPIGHLYFPETAVISEYQMLDDGRTLETALLGGESAAGITAAFMPSRAAGWTQVCVPGKAFKLDSAALRDSAERSPAVRAVLSETMVAHIGHISQKAICNVYHSVEERLCTWLLMLGERCGASELKITHDQIARVLGVYRPSVTCIARSLRERGAIDYVRGKIFMTGSDTLNELACACITEFCSDPCHRNTLNGGLML